MKIKKRLLGLVLVVCLMMAATLALTACKDEHTHTYGEVSYSWAADNSTCTATRTCNGNGCGYVDEETVNSISLVTQTQSATQVELTKYTATFTNPAFVEQVKENVQTEVAGLAKIGNVGYATLAEALSQVNAGEQIVVLGDISLTEGIVIASDKEVVIDLNGKTISYSSSKASADCAIKNLGVLIIKDSSANESGKITFVSSAPSAVNAYGTHVISNEGGTLTILGGTIENTTATGPSYAIDNNSTLGTTSLTIGGGTVVAVKDAIRAFANHATESNNINVTGGDITGNRAIYIHLPSNDGSERKVNVNISGGTLNSNDDTYNLAIYCYSFGNAYTGVKLNVLNGVFTGGIAMRGGSSNGGAGAEDVTIVGGTFTEVFTYGSAAHDIKICGGTFDVEPDADCIATGYEVTAQNEKFVVSAIIA